MGRWLLWLALLLPPCAASAEGFEAWLEGEIWPAAEARGVPRAVFDAAFEGFEPDRELPGMGLPPADGEREKRGQPEFEAPGRYFSRARFDATLALGRSKLRKWRTTLNEIEREYGVPPQIVIAIWGRESSFGRARLRHDAIRALATRAWLGRRKERFRGELVAALEVLASGEVPRGRLKSSSFGALGHPQFLPSVWLEHAVDFDGDGKRDIWRSVPDALASIASYLRAAGWQAGRDWGYEIELPPALPCTLEGPDGRRPTREWLALGVERTRGRSFAEAVLDEPGSLLLPAGRNGPAFLVTPNFYVLKEYNRADLYALYVGHLADRLVGERGFAGAWQPIRGLEVGDVKALQRALEAEGYDVGGVDGLVGFRTRTAIGAAQRAAGLDPTCFPGAPVGIGQARPGPHMPNGSGDGAARIRP